MIAKLAGCDWIRQRHSLLMIGPAGVGKSWPRGLLRRLLSPAQTVCHPCTGAWRRPIPEGPEGAGQNRPVILDDWGPEKLSDEQRRDLLEIVEDRYEKRSTIVTSQVPVEHWYGMIGNPTIADAILDRLVHSAYRIELTGESMRKKRSMTAAATT